MKKSGMALLLMFLTFISGIFLAYTVDVSIKGDKSEALEDLATFYEEEKNAMIALPQTEPTDSYDILYEDNDFNLKLEESMNVIYFGPTHFFLQLDAETLLHLLQYTRKSRITVSRTLLIWDILTDGKTAAFLQAREFLALGALLNFVPEEDLYHVNFGSQTVLNFFANHDIKLSKRKYGILASAYKRYYGSTWYFNKSRLNNLGYLLCGFPSSDLAKIQPKVLAAITIETLMKISKCTSNQTRVLYNIITHQEALGSPYSWGAEEIKKLSLLFIRIPVNDISTIHLEALKAIKPEVMKIIEQYKLPYFSKQQVLKMSSRTRRIYVLRLQLLNSYDIENIEDW